MLDNGSPPLPAALVDRDQSLPMLLAHSRRRWSETIEADVIVAGPSWPLEGRAFAAATGAACTSAQPVARSIRPPQDDRDSAGQRRVMLASLAPQPDPRRRSL